jgi:transcriptional regulator with XRE-family HTH domain
MNLEVRATGLRAMRQKHGLTQRELAQSLGVSQHWSPGRASLALSSGSS